LYKRECNGFSLSNTYNSVGIPEVRAKKKSVKYGNTTLPLQKKEIRVLQVGNAVV
jgi:hypothetical protein